MTNQSNSTQDTLMQRLERRFHSNARPFAPDTPPKIEVVGISSVPPPINPDGPEAAALIRELAETLAGSLKLIEADGLTYPRKWDATLAKAKAQQ